MKETLDAVKQAGLAADQELAGALLSGFETIRSMIEHAKPEQWSGRPKSTTKSHVQEFLERDPIFNALNASLSDVGFAEQFETNARDVLARVQKLVAHHQIQPDQIQNVERAYICILYMNILDGTRNPVQDTLIGSQADTYRELLTETNQAEISRARELRAYDLILAYAEQVASIDNPRPHGAAWLTQLWADLGPQSVSGDLRDFRGDLGELREDLRSIVDTLKDLSQYSKSATLDIERENILAVQLRELNTKAGLRHLAQCDVVSHLCEQGIGDRASLTHLQNIALVHAKGVSIPSEFRGDACGHQLIALAADGFLADKKRPEQESHDISKRFKLELRIRGDALFCESFESASGISPFSATADPHLRLHVYQFYQAVLKLELELPTADIISTGYNLRSAGLLNNHSTKALTLSKDTKYPDQGFLFLKNVGILSQHHVPGVDRLHIAFNGTLEEQIGAYAESGVAVHLIDNGHKVIALRKIGQKSNHMDYDVVAEIRGEIYGIEVKNTVQALQQKNYNRGGKYDQCQLNQLTQHAVIDGYKPAIICCDMRAISNLRGSLIDLWEGVSKLNGGTKPAIFDRFGNQFHLYG